MLRSILTGSARGAALLAAALILTPACAGDAPRKAGPDSENTMPQGRNRLGSEKSPYLLQHRDNPVWWHSWGQEAFDEAKRRNVPVFLSVGYSTCHWCHVMEHECFEDEEVADFLNQNFVAIKVDREERPDIDAIYMEAVHAMGQRGGWPMSVFLTPGGKPFFGGTYFPKPRFLHLLSRITDFWNNKRESLEQDAQKLMNHLQQSQSREQAGRLDEQLLDGFLAAMEREFDPVNGGSRGAPKFPASDDLRLLLRVHRRSGEQQALQIVRKTLDKMAAGGIYDHLGGGFCRYSTDSYWLVPHFEKMLYDQASLTLAYLEGWQVTGEKEYELVVREILDYVLREMTHPKGGFFSAEDADSDGEEGKFYVWTEAELKTLLDEKAYKELAANFEISQEGNFENGTNVLSLRDGHLRKNRSASLEKTMAKLFAVRDKRVHPFLDDKVLTDWNGLMIGAMARAGRFLDEPRYVKAAAKAAGFVLANARTEEGKLLHRWRGNAAEIPGFLEDYAYFIGGLIELYQADHDVAWLQQAAALQKQQDALFGAESGDYYTTDGGDATVLLRRSDLMDNVRPAGRSSAAMNLVRLKDLMVDPAYGERAAKVFAATPKIVERAPQAFSHLLLALDYALDRSKEVAVVGQPEAADTRAMVRAIDAGFQPNLVLAVGPGGEDAKAAPLLRERSMKGGRATAYVCENQVCRLPTTDPAKAAEMARTFKPLGKAAAR